MPATVTFLLGAGISIQAGIPDVRGFYRAFRAHLVQQFGATHDLMRSLDAIDVAWTQQYGSSLDDLERLYETLTFINDIDTPASIPLQLPHSFPPRSRQIELLHWELKKYVQQRCLSAPRNLAYLRPLAKFARISQPLTIISLNYDAYMEKVLDEAGVPWSDGGPVGDQEFFASNLDFPQTSSVHLIKLHGSATWYQTRRETEPGWMSRVRAVGQVGVSRKFGAARSLTHEAMMVYPTLNKALTNGPFPALTLKAQNALAKSDVCLAIGYAFGDIHVRRLVVESLSLNRRLKLILVNPKAKQILPILYHEAGATLHDRIGCVPLRFACVEEALKGDWLLDQSKGWIRGAPVQSPLLSSRGKIGGPKTRLPSRSRWRLRYPVPGGVAGLARGDNVLYLVGNQRREILELDLRTEQLRTLASGFQNLRGMAFDAADGMLYVVSNKYLSWPRRAPWSRGGIGQLWAINTATGVKRSVTRIDWLRTGLRFARNPRQLTQEAFWKNLAGGLRWPASVVVGEPGRSVLFTEARAIRKLDVRSKAISTPVVIPLPFNVVGLSLEAPNRLLVADAGVHPSGFGRLMHADLDTQRVDVLAGGWRGVNSVLFVPTRRLALLARVGGWPRGTVFSVDLDNPTSAPQYLWEGLNGPAQLCPASTEDEALVSTADGIVALWLD